MPQRACQSVPGQAQDFASGKQGGGSENVEGEVVSIFGGVHSLYS